MQQLKATKKPLEPRRSLSRTLISGAESVACGLTRLALNPKSLMTPGRSQHGPSGCEASECPALLGQCHALRSLHQYRMPTPCRRQVKPTPWRSHLQLLALTVGGQAGLSPGEASAALGFLRVLCPAEEGSRIPTVVPLSPQPAPKPSGPRRHRGLTNLDLSERHGLGSLVPL